MLLAEILRTPGTCVYGLISVQVLSLWMHMLFDGCIPTLYRCSTSRYVDHNAEYVKEHSVRAAPRLYVAHESTPGHVGFVVLLLGMADAASAVLPYTSGDKYMLGFAAVYFAPFKWLRVLCTLALMFIVATSEPPHVWGLIRVSCMLVSLLGSNMHLPCKYVVWRLLASCGFALAWCSAPCVSLLRAVPVAGLAAWWLHQCGANPSMLFIIVSLSL